MRHALVGAIEGRAAMVDDETEVREGARQLQRLGRLPGRDHQIEGQPERIEMPEPRLPGRVAHPVTLPGEGAGGVRVPAENVADADNLAVRGVALEDRWGLWRIEDGVADIAARHPVGFFERIEPGQFGKGLARLPAGFDMHGADDVVAGGIAQVVGRQAALSQHAAGTAQPGVLVERAVEQVVVWVDDRPGVEPVGIAHRDRQRPI